MLLVQCKCKLKKSVFQSKNRTWMNVSANVKKQIIRVLVYMIIRGILVCLMGK